MPNKKPREGKRFGKSETIAMLTQIADKAEEKANEGRGKSQQRHQQRADELRALIADLNSGKRDAAEIKIKGRVRVQKFAGVRQPDDDPVEVQEFITEA